MKTVYVVSTRTRGTGSFEWRYNEAEALAYHQGEVAVASQFAHPGDPYVTRYVGAVEVPDDLTSEGITVWLDGEGVEFWDFGIDADSEVL